MRGMRRSLEEVRSIDRTRTIDYLLTYLLTYVRTFLGFIVQWTYFFFLSHKIGKIFFIFLSVYKDM